MKKIGVAIANHEPERGGALLGIPNSNLITEFIEDPMANVTSHSYFPSSELTHKVNALELKYGIQFKGIVHSHPGNFNQPSGQDSNAFSLGLSINPRMPEFIAPIVTVINEHIYDSENEINLEPRGKITSYTAYRTKRPTSKFNIRSIYSSNANVEIEKKASSVMHIMKDLDSLLISVRDFLGSPTTIDEGYLNINGTIFLSFTYSFSALEAIILIPPDYPILKPTLLVSPISNGLKLDTEEVVFPWKLSFYGGSQLPITLASALRRRVNKQKKLYKSDFLSKSIGSTLSIKN